MAEELDFSDEGLAAMTAEKSEPSEPDEVVEDNAPDDLEGAEVQTPDEGVENTDDDPDPDSDAEAAAYAKRYEEAQKLIGRQGQELGELRAQMEAFKAAQEAEQQAPQAVPPGAVSQIVEHAENNPHEAFQYAIQYAPQAVPKVISQIRMTYGDDLAEEAQAAYTQIMIDSRMEAMQAEMMGSVAPIQQNYYEQAQRETVQSVAAEFLSSIDRSELDVIMPDLQQELSGWQEIINANPDPALMARALNASYAAAANKNVSRLQQLRQEAAQRDVAAKNAGRTETGSPGRTAAPSANSSEEESILKSIIGGGGAASPADIFNGFS